MRGTNDRRFSEHPFDDRLWMSLDHLILLRRRLACLSRLTGAMMPAIV